MTIALFMVDAGQSSGLGHLRRCASLANEFRGRNIDCVWLLTDETAQKIIKHEGMTVVQEAEQLGRIGVPSIVVSDHRRQPCEVPKSCAGPNLVHCVIDDLGDRRIVADIAVNPNCYGNTLRYDMSDNCLLLGGPTYCLVEPRLVALRAARDVQQNQRILITFGGTDDGRLGAAVAENIYGANIAQPSEIDLVLSPACCPSPTVAPAARAGVTVHKGAEMATLYSSARIVIGGASVTMAEAAAAGVPSIACRTADDQELNAAALRQLGLKVIDTFDPASIAAATAELLAEEAGNPLSDLIDGQGPARIANAISEKLAKKFVAA